MSSSATLTGRLVVDGMPLGLGNAMPLIRALKAEIEGRHDETYPSPWCPFEVEVGTNTIYIKWDGKEKPRAISEWIHTLQLNVLDRYRCHFQGTITVQPDSSYDRPYNVKACLGRIVKNYGEFVFVESDEPEDIEVLL